MTSQLVMIGTTSTAVYLLDHGHDVQMIGLAVSLTPGRDVRRLALHRLADRPGRAAGDDPDRWLSADRGGCGGGLASGSNGLLVALMFCLNGIGWNFAFVSGSALLTDALGRRRTSMQGFADLMTGLMGALGSTLGGIVLQSWGFAVLNAAGRC